MVEAGLAGLLAAALGRRGGRANQRIEVVNRGMADSMPPHHRPPNTITSKDPHGRRPSQPAPAVCRFPTDLTDTQWRLLSPLLPAHALALAGRAARPPADVR
jgi:hypothetical protein